MNNNMNKKMRMLIICAVFALISSCKNYASTEDLKQNVEGKVRGFLETKKGIVSDDPTVYEIAEKLKEEELKDKKENKKDVNLENKEELIQGDDPNNINQAQILQANSQDSKPELEAVQQSESGGQQKEEEKKEEQKVVEQKEEQVRAKAEAEEEEKRQQEEKKVKAKIKDLTNKIDKINKDIDSIKHQRWFVEEVERVIVGAQEVIDKVTGPIYDYFTDKSDTAIYYTWGLSEEDGEELGKLLEELRDTRDNLRTKLNEGNKAATWNNTPLLKENVKVVEIESDLDELKSELEKVKTYLTNESNFEEIKEYVSSQ